jgi:hypothetical protein
MSKPRDVAHHGANIGRRWERRTENKGQPFPSVPRGTHLNGDIENMPIEISGLEYAVRNCCRQALTRYFGDGRENAT